MCSYGCCNDPKFWSVWRALLPDILVPGQGLYWTELHTENWSPMRDLNSRYAKVAKFAEHSVGNLTFLF